MVKTYQKIAVTIAGSDSGAGAGIQADLKSFIAHHVYGATVITALTAQNTQGVQDVYPIPADFVRRQIQSLKDDFIIGAIKIGMVADENLMRVIADSISDMAVPIIFDPVMVAQSGDSLLAEDAINALRDIMVPVSDILTPNLYEAAVLCETTADDITNHIEDALKKIHAMMQKKNSYVLIKGGHINDNISAKKAIDYLYDGQHIQKLEADFHDCDNNHGTGCSLSSAIAAHIVKGENIIDAVTKSKDYINHAIFHAKDCYYGQGNNPIAHFYHWQDTSLST